jgi:hypothetical protein
MISATDIYTFNENGGGFKLYCKYNLNKVIQALGVEKDRKKNAFIKRMSKLGATHEKYIFNHIYDTYGSDKMREFKRDEEQRKKTYELIGRQELLNETQEAIDSGIPFIFEPYLCNEISGVNGYIDILIRIDYFIDMFNSSLLPKKIINDLIEEKKKFGNIYVIIDNKYSGLKINLNFSLNAKMKKYKIQLQVYHELLKEFQPNISQYSFVLCPNIERMIKKIKVRNTLKSIGFFDHQGKEVSEINNIISDAITWIQDIKKNGKNYVLLPEPSDEHLEPEPGVFDYPHSKIIKEYKKKLYKNENENDSNFPFFDKIHLSKESYSKLKSFYNNEKYTLFIDNETVTRSMTNSFKNFPEMDGCSGAYMIGVIICKGGKEIGRKQFTPDELTEDGIYQVHKKFNDIIINKLGLENISKIFHYGTAEIGNFNGFIRDEPRHSDLLFFKNFEKNKSLFEDLCKIIREIKLPIIDGNGLKPVSKFFYKHNKITTLYDEMDGLLTIPLIIKYYGNKEKYSEIFRGISEYNYKDCIVLKEIVEVLFKHHQRNTKLN